MHAMDKHEKNNYNCEKKKLMAQKNDNGTTQGWI